MNNLEYIESYFTNAPGLAETRAFEERIGSDPVFAEEVAYYLSVLKVAREESRLEKKIFFKNLYQKNQVSHPVPVRKLIYYIAAAAAVVGIIFGIYTFIKPVSPRQLAGKYINEHLQTLGVTMSGRSDSLQTGLQYYNEGKSAEALRQFESIIRQDTSNFTAKEYAGLTALRLKEYDKAIQWFTSLETYSDLFANPAQLYLALTFMERNQPGDEERAKKILQEIIQQDGEGKETAQEWLSKL